MPSLLTTKGMLIGISSAYRRAGLLYTKHRDHFGVDTADVLVVKGSTEQFNRTVDDAALAAMRAADPTAARSEWDSEFRADLTGFLDDAVIDRAVDRNRPLELMPMPYPAYYKAFVDPSGGASSGDSYSIAICHREKDRYVVDIVRAKQGPFNPYELTKQYAELCRQYRITSVVGDNYAKEWTQQAWRDCNISYTLSDLTASQLYAEMEPLFTRGLVSLPDHPALLRELRLLERRPGNIAKEAIGHPRGVHDDLANAIAGALRLTSNYLGFDTSWRWVSGDDDKDKYGVESWRRLRLHAYLNSGGRVIL